MFRGEKMFGAFNKKKIESEIDKEYIKQLEKDLSDLEKKYAESIANKPVITKEDSARLADLEVKMAKLWSLLVEQTPRGQDRLTRYGKVFGGKSKGLL
jgi:hypothetical protein